MKNEILKKFLNFLCIKKYKVKVPRNTICCNLKVTPNNKKVLNKKLLSKIFLFFCNELCIFKNEKIKMDNKKVHCKMKRLKQCNHN